jgi:hypothetical protein
MPEVQAFVVCASCGGRVARDNADTTCSPCRRTMIEQSANRHVMIARDRDGIQSAFDSAGLYAVAHRLKCTPEEALDVLISARLVPFVSQRRRAMLRQVVRLRDRSHVAVAEALNISRWTVATYRHQLGIDRVPAAPRHPKQ